MNAMTPVKPLASISLDLDDLWTYLRTRGDPAWESHPSYLPSVVPRILEMFDEFGLHITFFVVGYDATCPANVPSLQAIARRGHEIGNHSFSHESWVHLHTPDHLAEEVEHAEEVLHAVTGQSPTGFRGPGFSWSPQLLNLLAQRHYRYDASTLPTFLGPLARLYFLSTAKLPPHERSRRQALFGSFRDGLRPVGAYHWRLEPGRTLLEIPVTTIPIVKVPFHMSYLLYLSRFSRQLMYAYLHVALASCRALGVEPSFLLHPLDFLEEGEAPQLRFFPGIDVPWARKRELLREVLHQLRDQFEVVTMDTHARAFLSRGELRQRVPVLATSALHTNRVGN